MAFADYKTALVTGASSGIGAAVVERRRPKHQGHAQVARMAADALAKHSNVAGPYGLCAARDSIDRHGRPDAPAAGRSTSISS